MNAVLNSLMPLGVVFAAVTIGALLGFCLRNMVARKHPEKIGRF